MVLCVLMLRRASPPTRPPPLLFHLAQKLSHFMMVFSRPDFQTYWSKHLESTVKEFLIILS